MIVTFGLLKHLFTFVDGGNVKEERVVCDAVGVVLGVLDLPQEQREVLAVVLQQLLQLWILDVLYNLVEIDETSSTVIFDFQDGFTQLDNQILRVKSRDFKPGVLRHAWEVEFQINLVALVSIEDVGLRKDLSSAGSAATQVPKRCVLISHYRANQK